MTDKKNVLTLSAYFNHPFFTGMSIRSPSGTPYSVWHNPNTGNDVYLNKKDLLDYIGGAQNEKPYRRALTKLCGFAPELNKF
jgi:hypothetical protein